jgi:acetyl esterase/lipase
MFLGRRQHLSYLGTGVFALGLVLCGRMTGQAVEERGNKVPPVGTKFQYKLADGVPLYLYVSSPPQPDKGTHPAILFFHGGGWTMGNVSQFNQQSAYLASRGMVAIQVDYRLISKQEPVSPQVCVEDAKSAMRWVRSHAKELHIQPDKIAAGGGSAGGYMAAVLGMVPGWDDPADDLSISAKADALVLMNPVIDIGPESLSYRRFGTTYKAHAPMSFVSASTPPMIIQNGSADKLVAPQSLRDFQAMVKAAGVQCELITYDGQPHGFFTSEPYTTLTTKAAVHFLESIGYLAPSSTEVKLPTDIPYAGKPK